MAKIEELKEKIKLLSLENQTLVERVEEIEVLSLISKNLENALNVEDVYKIVLERISIMKTIPYCGVFGVKNDTAALEIDYSYLSNDVKLVESFSFTKKVIRQVLKSGHLCFNRNEQKINGVKLKFSDKYFIPDCFLFIPFELFDKKGFFLFADNCIEHDISSFANYLEQVVRLSESKATTFLLMEIITKQNDNLEELVEEKSKKLVESEAKYRGLIEHVPDSIVIINNGIFEFVNSSTLNLFEADTKSELLGEKLFDFIVPADRSKAKQNIEEIQKSDTDKITKFGHYRVTTLKGNKIIVQISGIKFVAHGQDRIQLIISNITEKVKSKEIIENQNKFLNTVIDSISNPFIVVDSTNYKIILANPAAEKIGKNVGQKCYNQYGDSNDEFCGSAKCPLNIIKETGKAYSVEREHIDSNGELRIYEILGYPVLNKAGELVQMIEYTVDVTEYKKTLSELSTSEQKFRMLFDNAAVGLVLLDSKNKVVNINKSALAIFELQKENVIGSSGNDFFTAEKKHTVPEKFKKILNEGYVKFEREYAHNGKQNKYLEILGTKLSDNLVIISVLDLTEKKKAEVQIFASEKKFKSLIEQSPIGLFICQNESIIFTNSIFSKMLGYEKNEDLYGKDISDFIDSKYRDIAETRIHKLFDNRENSDSVEEKFIRKDGKIIDVLVLRQSIEFEGENVIQGYVYDITEDKKLREENHVLKSGIECITDTAVIVLDTVGQINYVNPGFTSIYGYTEEEILGERIEILKSFKMDEFVYAALEKGIKYYNEYQGELINKAKDGKLINVEVSLTPIYSADNEFYGYIEIHKDISERRKAEKELLEAKENAEKADQVKSEFLAQMSHEIRTPINAIVSFSALLKEELQDIVSDDLKTSFSLINRAGNRIIRTIDLLLNLAEIQTGSFQCIFKQINLYEDVLSSIIVNYKYLARQKNIEMIIKIDAENAMVTADAYSLEQVFKNIIDNAVKYTLNGSVTICISRHNGILKVEISDTGIGISKEYLPKLFEPFSQEESGYTRSFEGNGIGLALVREYCRLNNISINVESQKGIGSTFALTF